MPRAQALQAATLQLPDLIVLDVMMPEMDGFEFMRLYRRNKDVPIILLTARVEADDRILGLESCQVNR
ncbi:MAG: response regulator [Anaerolineales bacterium]|nr:response regulator [Anaerolineales bacterium]